MSRKACPSCGMNIDASAESCPGCGADTRDVEILPDSPAPENEPETAASSAAPGADVPPWNFCTDQLPDDDNVKLIYTDEGAYDIAGCVDDENNTWSCSPMIGNVLMWMELPPPRAIDEKSPEAPAETDA